MRIVVLFSGSASSLQYVLENSDLLNKKMEIVGAICDQKNASGIEVCTKHKIPCEVRDYKAFVLEKAARFSDESARNEYFQQLLRIVENFEADIIMLSGWMLITPADFIEHYQNRILNVHPADLRILNEDGSRKYTGLHVVERAINDGALATRSTIHVVTEGVDAGPIVVVSDPLEIAGLTADEHQEIMKTMCDGPAYVDALRLISEGRVWVDSETQQIEIRES